MSSRFFGGLAVRAPLLLDPVSHKVPFPVIPLALRNTSPAVFLMTQVCQNRILFDGICRCRRTSALIPSRVEFLLFSSSVLAPVVHSPFYLCIEVADRHAQLRFRTLEWIVPLLFLFFHVTIRAVILGTYLFLPAV